LIFLIAVKTNCMMNLVINSQSIILHLLCPPPSPPIVIPIDGN